MKKDANTMKKVAERCTQYAPNGECHCTNSTAGDNVTCKIVRIMSRMKSVPFSLQGNCRKP